MVKIKFHSHSCFEISNKDKALIIDPWLSDNPLAVVKPDEIEAKYILVSHGHGDHLGDTLEIAKQNDATIIAPFELATYCERKGAKVHPMHIGGGYNFDFGYVK